MSKNIVLQEYEGNNSYKILYPKTSGGQTFLSEETSTYFGLTNGTVDDAFEKISDKFSSSKFLTMKVIDMDGNPIVGASISGFKKKVVTDVGGMASGFWQSDPMYVASPYVDMISKSVNGASYAGTPNVLTVTLTHVSNLTELQYTASQTIKFSQRVKTVDVCCVGGGGGGVTPPNDTISSYGPGGGGGGIVNAMNITPPINTDISVIVGSGGLALNIFPNSSSARQYGGASKFGNLVVANGGSSGYGERSSGKVYAYGGEPGAANCGQGGSAASYGTNNGNGTNSTVSKFNNNTTFYSGGGGGGYYNPVVDAYGQEYYQSFSGGNPNGADGGEVRKRSSTGYDITDAGIAEIGGGGGGGYYYSSSAVAFASSGGNGIVYVRIHLT